LLQAFQRTISPPSLGLKLSYYVRKYLKYIGTGMVLAMEIGQSVAVMKGQDRKVSRQTEKNSFWS
jgi:hypothetical protein